MFSAIRKRMTYANVAMTLALVFAMTGGALAASHKGKHAKRHKQSAVVITSTKQISKSVLTALKGGVGPVGPQGPTGPAGPAGAKGGTGLEGKAGKDGANGTNGTNGKSVVAASETAGANCAEGGASFEVEGSGVKHYACNGKNGASVKMTELPPESAACPAGGEEFTVGTERGAACNGVAAKGGSRKLESGESESGFSHLAVDTHTSETNYLGAMSIDFSVPLTTEQAENATVRFFKLGEAYPTGCSAITSGNIGVRAEPGYLCIYAEGGFGFESTSVLVPSTLNSEQGAGLNAFAINKTENALMLIKWALTVK